MIVREWRARAALVSGNRMPAGRAGDGQGSEVHAAPAPGRGAAAQAAGLVSPLQRSNRRSGQPALNVAAADAGIQSELMAPAR